MNPLRPGPSMSGLRAHEVDPQPIRFAEVDESSAPFAYLHEPHRGDEPDPETGQIRMWDADLMGEYDPEAQIWRFPEGNSPLLGIATKTRRSTQSPISPPTANPSESPDYAADDTGYVVDDACQ